MKLYLAPGACSLSEHIALHEAGIEFDRVKVDLKTKRTADGADYWQVNPKGYVPALVLDDGQVLTENVAILSWIAERVPRLAPAGEMGRLRLVEMLAFLCTEVHKPFLRMFFPTSDADKDLAIGLIAKRLQFIADRFKGDYLFGRDVSVADPLLYVLLRWARMKQLQVRAPLPEFIARMQARPAVELALRHEVQEKV